MTIGDAEAETPKGLTLVDFWREESNRYPCKTELPATPEVGSIQVNARLKQYDAMDVVKWDTR